MMLFATFFFSHGVKWDLLFFSYNKFTTGCSLPSIFCYRNNMPKTAPKTITKIGCAFTLNKRKVNTA